MGKRRQVFLHILILKQMRNTYSLKLWSMIQTVAYYVWGMGKNALDAFNYWGMTCSSHTRDRCLALLTKRLSDKQTKFLSSEDAITYCMDNCQKSMKLKHQREKHCTGELSGTNQIDQKVFEFNNPENDDYYTDLIYDPGQSYPSPYLMRGYHKEESTSGAAFSVTIMKCRSLKDRIKQAHWSISE